MFEVNGRLVAKISDFGLANVLSTTTVAKTQTKAAGSYPWMVPEVYDGDYSEASDVWAYGITLVEIWTDGDTPYKGWMNAFVMEQVLDCYKLQCPETMPPRFYNKVVGRTLEYEAKSRLNFKDLAVITKELMTDPACVDSRTLTRQRVDA